MLLVDEWIQAEGDGRVKLLMQVHDELVFEVQKSQLLAKIESKVQELMESAADLRSTVSRGSDPRWQLGSIPLISFRPYWVN